MYANSWDEACIIRLKRGSSDFTKEKKASCKKKKGFLQDFYEQEENFFMVPD